MRSMQGRGGQTGWRRLAIRAKRLRAPPERPLADQAASGSRRLDPRFGFAGSTRWARKRPV
jgi:hypothetical protein